MEAALCFCKKISDKKIRILRIDFGTLAWQNVENVNYR